MYLFSTSFFILLLLIVWLFKKKMILGIWSISVFNSRSILSSFPGEEKFKEPTLQASDVWDVPAEFVADPFIIAHDNKFFMFFEILDKSTGKGIIGLASSEDGDHWNYERAVIKENYHLSYPYVFKHNDSIYMIPETSEANKVLLYKAKNFPYEWEIASELLQGNYVDSSIFKYDGKWWIFAGKSGKLHLFYSDDLEKNWTEHPKSPLITNNYSITRPGGRVIVENNNIYRYTQDGKPYYGSAVRVFKITKLSEVEYQEEEISKVLNGSKRELDWNRDGMHSVDHLEISKDHWLIAVDGHKFKNMNYLSWKIDRLLARWIVKVK